MWAEKQRDLCRAGNTVERSGVANQQEEMDFKEQCEGGEGGCFVGRRGLQAAWREETTEQMLGEKGSIKVRRVGKVWDAGRNKDRGVAALTRRLHLMLTLKWASEDPWAWMTGPEQKEKKIITTGGGHSSPWFVGWCGGVRLWIHSSLVSGYHRSTISHCHLIHWKHFFLNKAKDSFLLITSKGCISALTDNYLQYWF